MQHVHIQSLTLDNFRNWEHLFLDDLGDRVLFIGPNAVGKTSILESLFSLCAVQQLRARKIEQMIRWDTPEAHIQAQITGDRELTLEAHLAPAKRQVLIQGKKRKQSDLREVIPAISFTPDDLRLVKGSASRRRDALDAIGFDLSKNYAQVRTDYQKLIQQKNQALKQHSDSWVIDSIDDLLIRVGSQLVLHRYTIEERIHSLFEEYYADISQSRETATMKYQPFFCSAVNADELDSKKNGIQIPARDKDLVQHEFERLLKLHRDEEQRRESCLVGPHKDTLDFYIQGHNALHFASQGQQRSVALSFILAHAQALHEALETSTLLLLDDVMSELDEYRRSYLLDTISGVAQSFVTATNTEYFSQDFLRDADVRSVRLENGLPVCTRVE